MEPTSAADPGTPREIKQPSDADPLLEAGVELLKALPHTEEHACRNCGRPSGLFDECDRCFLDRIESQFAELMGGDAVSPPAPPAAAPEPETETEPEPEPEPAPEPEPEPVSTPPPNAPVLAVPPPGAPAAAPAAWRPSSGAIVAAVAAIVVLIVAGMLIWQAGSSDDAAAPTEPPILTPGEEPAATAAPVLGTWAGRVEIRYEGGFTDHMNQTITIKRLNEGGPAGFSHSRQNGGTCRGPLTFLGTRGDAYRFSYQELNTQECIATGTVTLTPRGDSLAYKEVTRATVNRGTLAPR